MLVMPQILQQVKNEIAKCELIALDTETTGLMPWKDKLFSIIIATEGKEYYFNFNEKTEVSASDSLLSRNIISGLLSDFKGTIFLHNAKFDMHFCLNEGLDLRDPRFTIHCTEAIGRVEYNDHMSYSLDNLGQKLGYKKMDAVKEYCDKHKLWEWEYPIEKKNKVKKRFYDRVPLEVIVPYGCMDARITYELGKYQMQSIMKQDMEMQMKYKVKNGPLTVMNQERELTKVLFDMERTGIKLNTEFVQDAWKDATFRAKQAMVNFHALTGVPFVDSGKTLAPIFDRLGEKYPLTEKGNPSFADDVLDQLSGPIGKIIQDYRNNYKKANTYYANYLYLADDNGFIHPNFRQGGTAFGRMSCSNPNMQNANKVEEGSSDFNEQYLVRRCFIPEVDEYLVAMDYDQMEYRLMLDYAGEMPVIEEVLSGVDVHQATANLMGVPRKQAKTINFMLLYGGGIAKLALALFEPTVTEEKLKQIQQMSFQGKSVERISALLTLDRETVKFNIEQLEKAGTLKKLYFSKLPKVEQFIGAVKGAAISRGYIFNWMGRKCIFADSKWGYKAPNALIQGGTADIVKRAMVNIHTMLKDRGARSHMKLQVHDELVFGIKKDEMHLIPDLKLLMETAYPSKYLPLTVGVEYSETSWQDKQEYVA